MGGKKNLKYWGEQISKTTDTSVGFGDKRKSWNNIQNFSLGNGRDNNSVSPACVLGQAKASWEQRERYRKPKQLLSFVSKSVRDHCWDGTGYSLLWLCHWNCSPRGERNTNNLIWQANISQNKPLHSQFLPRSKPVLNTKQVTLVLINMAIIIQLYKTQSGNDYLLL